MTKRDIENLLEKQRVFYKSGATIPVRFRIEQLKKLYAAVKKYEKEINDALTADLGKSHYEGFMCESGLVLSEISYMIRHTKKFAKKKKVRTPLAQFASCSFKQPVPYGNTLIMSPWNYPFLLTIDPLADAIAAGNTAIVIPSAYSPATSKIIEKIITECFAPEYVAVVTGGGGIICSEFAKALAICGAKVALLDINYDAAKKMADEIGENAVAVRCNCLDKLSIEEAKKRNIPIISCMGTGNKLDPTLLTVTDLSKTKGCPLARVMRRELGRLGVKHLKVVYSKEEARKPVGWEEEAAAIGKRQIPGSVSFVPGAAGLILAGEVIKDLIGV